MKTWTTLLPTVAILNLEWVHSFSSLRQNRNGKFSMSKRLSPDHGRRVAASSPLSAVATTDVAQILPTPVRVPSNQDINDLPAIKPKLLVFDLDGTMWTPELYQIRQRDCPIAGRDIKLFAGMREILTHYFHNQDEWSGTKLAIASRTSKGHWARQLLTDFDIEGVPLGDLFHLTHIYTGSKKTHFAKLREETGYSYEDMVFFDDDVNLNLKEIATQLGVLSCHCPRGMTTKLFTGTLDSFAQLRGKDERWMGYIVNGVNLGLEAPTNVDEGRVTIGRVKMYNPAKRFGFLQELGAKDKKDFFFHESKVADGLSVRKGMAVEFETMVDKQGRPSAAILRLSDGSPPSAQTKKKNEMISMPCFSMSQPFASLLLNGVKTVETRNNDMFTNLPAGSKVLLACGRRDWRDQEAPRRELRRAGFSDEEIDQLSSLPRGFRKGDIVGVLTLGETWLSTKEERLGSNLQRKVVSAFEGIGRYCTQIEDCQWLKKGISQQRGQPGIYDVRISKSDLVTDSKPVNGSSG